ncbi:hypothetical protein TR51_25555 [Kitasatospora griseola]|uniref:Holin n=1 Tax=Kitasatospora griseola TaxID=2064 RepID=A0A0D0PUW0_KITGR|nr:hypothetical protein TR51_25555 [Kitasatospora griseola]
MFTKAFALDTAIRVLRTFAQTLIAALGLDSMDAIHAPWPQALAVAGGAAIMALLTALAGVPTGPAGAKKTT